ncbi:hypothetical protein TSTA_001930 [Talaromyces stipitatus ATCC 10500]|uniref:MULE transposase domain-containing protein n=1 Tax=Talaromyces stipitatus (strain ATCC 10500 / CBS 375.48 / QM 6759 / NRRL 1006) TaxID=441959 RepID=B8MS67_TALSN|nr:uncharacterized protein TSTA_001930 [Talaromyces stipitatus ATCC 10500]EED12125.1 hypothetical protein TSTA_001930 [Talaromyces stipitatus ATCC 10500]
MHWSLRDPKHPKKAALSTEFIFSAAVEEYIVSVSTKRHMLERQAHSHNHYSAAGSTLASLHYEEIESKETQIKSYLDSYMTTNQILSTLYNDNRESIIKLRDIYNKKRKLRDKFLDGKTPVQALISVVPDNRFSFILDEKEESYKFILECLAKVYAQVDLLLPNYILTDKDMALMNTITTHIEKNILTRVRPILTNEVLHTIYSGNPAAVKKDITKYKTHIKSQWKDFFRSFNKIVYAKTKEEKDEAVNSFKVEYSSETWQEVMDYIDSEWLNNSITQRFLHCYLLNIKHFG